MYQLLRPFIGGVGATGSIAKVYIDATTTTVTNTGTVPLCGLGWLRRGGRTSNPSWAIYHTFSLKPGQSQGFPNDMDIARAYVIEKNQGYDYQGYMYTEDGKAHDCFVIVYDGTYHNFPNVVYKGQVLPEGLPMLERSRIRCLGLDDACEPRRAASDDSLRGTQFDLMVADHLLSSSTLPDYRTLRDAGKLQRVTIHLQDVIDHADMEKVVVVSHRWIGSDHPDPHGEQLRAIQEFLWKNPQIEHLWIDWCCLPQGDRTPAEAEFFRGCLHHANLLYLRFFVLVVADSAYLSRFWTQFEYLLAMRRIEEGGLVPNDGTRHDVLVTGIDAGSPEQMVQTLYQRWAKCSIAEASMSLSASDVQVTNGGDKTLQLNKLKQFQDAIRESWRQVMSNRHEAH